MCLFFVIFDGYLGNGSGNMSRCQVHDRQGTRAKKIVGRVPILNGLCCKTSTSLIDSGDALSILAPFFRLASYQLFSMNRSSQ